MLLTSLFTWWYGVGWVTLVRKVNGRINGVLRFFSVWQLLGSLFAPFRQISAGRVQGPLGVKIRAWGDRQFSRVIGAIVRTLLILCGFIGAATYSVFGFLLIVLWPCIPFMPFVGVVLTIAGVKLL